MLKRIIKKVKSVLYKRKFQNQSTKDVFTSIFETNYWGDRDSVSGEGSNLEQTKHLRSELINILNQYHIKSILDIPCGDFHWMSRLDLKDVKYVGGDIVDSLIDTNRKNYSTDQKSFKVLDIIEDKLPTVDIVFVRDCLVHLSDENIKKAFQNIKKSESKYLLTTSFIKQVGNKDIITGDWRPINLQLAPYNLPKPIATIDEKSSESGGKFADKSLLLWLIKDLPDS